MLEISGLASGYDRIPIVRDISFRVTKGASIGLLGHNGMGKTTLLRTVAGHIEATSGSVHFMGSDITRLTPSRRARMGLGYVPQGRQIFANLTTLENLRMGAAGIGHPDQVIDGVIDDLPRVKPILHRQGGVLSGGEQQILALGRCLCGLPKLILLDEPTEGIQPSIIHEMIELLHELKRKRGLTIILVEQNVKFIRKLADSVLLIHKGRIVGQVPPEDLDATHLVQQLLGFGQDTEVTAV